MNSTRPRDGWHSARIDRVATVRARIGWKALTADEYKDGGYVFLSTPNIKGVDIDFDSVNYISEYRYDESPELKLAIGDVLLAKDGNTLGITNVVTALPRPATVNGSIAVIRPTGVYSRFMMYWIASDYTQRRIDSLRAGMGVPHLFQWDINRLPIMFPAQQSDQTRIADFLDGEVARIDALVAKKRRMLRLLDIQWQATVSDRLWNASPYERVRLRHLAGRPTSGNRDHGSFSFSDDGVPCLRGINVKPAKIMRRDLYRIDEHASQEHAATILRAGDLVIVRSGFAGAAALVPSDLDGANCVDLVVVRKCSAIVPKYLEYVVNSREAQEQVRYGSSGALLTHFNAVDAGNLAIPVRNIETQKAIVEELDSRFEQVEKLRSLLDRQIDLLEEHRQALITAAVTGEMEVPGVSR